MDVYGQNVEVINKYYPDIAEKLSLIDSSKVEVIETPCGYPTFLYGNGHPKKQLFHSRFNPIKEAYQLLAPKNFADTKIVFVLGLGFGYHLQQLLKKPGFDGLIYIIEPSLEIFKAALENRDLRDIFSQNERIRILINPDAEDVRETIAASSLFGGYACKCEFVYSPVYHHFFEQYFKTVLDAINVRVTRGATNPGVIEELSCMWEKNLLANLPYMLKSVPLNALIDKFKGVPGIIVAAGPSLDKNIAELKRFKSKAVIISLGTSLKPLLKAGIIPDFVVTLDASDVTWAQFNDLAPEQLNRIWLLTEITTYAPITEKFYPRVSFYHSMENSFIKYLYGQKLSDQFYAQCGGSVANSALDLALKFGMEPLVLVGQDLALSDDGRTHASGSMHEKKRINTSEPNLAILKVPGNYQEAVTTARNFFLFIRWIERYIKNHPGKEFVNATAGGARIEGTKLMTLDEVFTKYCSRDIDVEKIMHCLSAKNNRIPLRLKWKIGKLFMGLKKTDRMLGKALVLSREMSDIVGGKKALNEKQEKQFSAKARKFFLKLDKLYTMDLLNYRSQRDTVDMAATIHTSRMKGKGYNDVITKMPAAFEAMLKSSEEVAKTCRRILSS